MAIIKCPECGHQISDKARTCPNCGIEIAGKITRCPNCGEIYFKGEVVCPHCHKPTREENDKTGITGQEDSTLIATEDMDDGKIDRQSKAADTSETISNTPVPTPLSEKEDNVQNSEGENKKNNKTILIVSLIIAVLAISVCFYIYNKAQNGKEQEEYEFAMSSDDPTVLQAYLDNFKDAPQEHIDSINAHLERISMQDQDWTNAVISGTKSALNAYIKNHPDSPHREEALSKIDSIDWEQSSNINTSDSYQMYIDAHPDGDHYDEAVIALKKLKDNELSAEEKQMISDVFRRFFQSINSKDENGLTMDLSDEGVNFLGKPNATKDDVISFMHKIYKPEIKNMVWSIVKNYDIKKTPVSDGQYEFTVKFTAIQKIDKTDDTSTSIKYNITSKLGTDMKIEEMSMVRFNE